VNKKGRNKKNKKTFPMPYVLFFFVFNGLRSEAIVYYFVDISGIVNHH